MFQVGMFGHVDAGCITCPPALEFSRFESQEPMIREKYWQSGRSYQINTMFIVGEHGKGVRSELRACLLRETVILVFSKLKALLIQENHWIPVKLATPLSWLLICLKNLDRRVPLRGQIDRQIPLKIEINLKKECTCNGKRACYNFDPMMLCGPSWKRYTRS